MGKSKSGLFFPKLNLGAVTSLPHTPTAPEVDMWLAEEGYIL